MVMLCDIVCMTFGFAYSWLRCAFMETLQEHFLLREKVKPDLFSVVWDVTFSIQFYFAVILYCVHLKNRSCGLPACVSCVLFIESS